MKTFYIKLNEDDLNRIIVGLWRIEAEVTRYREENEEGSYYYLEWENERKEIHKLKKRIYREKNEDIPF